MGGSRKNEVSATQLLNVSQALKLRCVNDANKKRVHLNVPMNWIIKNLQKPNNNAINVYLTLKVNRAKVKDIEKGQGFGGTGCINDCLISALKLAYPVYLNQDLSWRVT